MANPKDTIRRGLDAHERARTGPNTPKLAHLAGVTGDQNSLNIICDSVRKTRARLFAMREIEAKEATTAAASIKADWKDKGVTIDDRGIRSDSLRDTRRKHVEKDVKDARKVRQEKTTEERAKLAATLRTAKESLDLVRDLWASPVALLMRQTLGSDKRATYAQNLAAAGPQEVDDAMSQAVRTGDKDRAAAACTRIDAMGKEPRKLLTISKSDVAEELVSKEFNAATETLGLADYYRESGDLAAREMDGRPVNPNDKIRVGQKLMELEIRIGRKIDVDGDETSQKEGEDFDTYLDRKYPGGALPEGMTVFNDDGSENNG